MHRAINQELSETLDNKSRTVQWEQLKLVDKISRACFKNISILKISSKQFEGRRFREMNARFFRPVI